MAKRTRNRKRRYWRLWQRYAQRCRLNGAIASEWYNDGAYRAMELANPNTGWPEKRIWHIFR